MSPQLLKDDLTLLIEAYELADDPKPSLGTVIAQIRKKELTAVEGEDGFYYVGSAEDFNAELSEWKRRKQWTPNVRAYSVIPDGHVTIIGFCRENVAPEPGREKRLYDGKSNPPRFSSRTREYLKAGDCPEAKLVGSGIWVAPPSALRTWLKSRFQIYVR